MKIYANYGAMHPREELTIRLMRKGIATAVTKTGAEVRVEVETIRDSRPTTGSPVGYYWNKMDA